MKLPTHRFVYRQPVKTNGRSKIACSLLTFNATLHHTNTIAICTNSDRVNPQSAQEEKSNDTLPTLKKLIVKRALEYYCTAATLSVCQSGRDSLIGLRKVPVRKFPVVKTFQVVAPNLLRARILCLAPQRPAAGHQIQRCMYASSR